MPLFYFDMREDRAFLPDPEGQECADLNVAERIACETAAEFGRNRLPSGDTRKVTIEVRNERKQRVLTATVRLELDRVHPGP